MYSWYFNVNIYLHISLAVPNSISTSNNEVDVTETSAIVVTSPSQGVIIEGSIGFSANATSENGTISTFGMYSDTQRNISFEGLTQGTRYDYVISINVMEVMIGRTSGEFTTARGITPPPDDGRVLTAVCHCTCICLSLCRKLHKHGRLDLPNVVTLHFHIVFQSHQWLYKKINSIMRTFHRRFLCKTHP